jgi:hypothetical protein
MIFKSTQTGLDFDTQQQVIKFTSCLPRVGGSLQELWLPPPLKQFFMIFKSTQTGLDFVKNYS